MTTLPLELHDEVLSHLSDSQTLPSASLVCKHWLDITRPAILGNKEIEFRIGRQDHTFPILMESPHVTLPSFIRKAGIYGCEMGTAHSPSQYEKLGEEILTCLAQFSKLQKLSIGYLTWASLPASTRDGLTSSFPCLEVLCLSFVRFSSLLELIDTVGSFGKIKGIQLFHPVFEEGSTADAATVSKLFNSELSALKLSFSSHTMHDFVTSVSQSGCIATSLRTLYIDKFDADSCIGINGFLKMLPSLENLGIQTYRHDKVLLLDLSTQTKLHLLELGEVFPLAGVPQLLKSIRSQVFTEFHFWGHPLHSKNAFQDLWEQGCFPPSLHIIHLKYIQSAGGGFLVPEDMRSSVRVVEKRGCSDGDIAKVFQDWCL